MLVMSCIFNISCITADRPRTCLIRKLSFVLIGGISGIRSNLRFADKYGVLLPKCVHEFCPRRRGMLVEYYVTFG